MNKTKRMLKVITSIVCIAMIAALLMPLTSFAADNANSGTDIILVVDDTGSMKFSDPQKLSAEAIRKFVDCLPSNGNIRLGIATYAIEIMPTPISLGNVDDAVANFASNRDAIKKFANNNITQAGKGTDAAKGIKWAVDELMKDGSGRKKAIILIGDGDNSFEVDYKEVRKSSESDAMRDAAIQNAKDKGIVVYTIAINNNAKSDTFKKYFEHIANFTNGKPYEVKSIEQIDPTMKEIFTLITGQKIVELDDVPLSPGVPATQSFDVPADVFEMILKIDHNQPLADVTLKTEGTEYTKDNLGENYQQETAYTTIRIRNPKEGSWTVTYTSDIAQTISPDFVFYKDAAFGIELTMDPGDITQQIDHKYYATIKTDGNQITDENELKHFVVKLNITQLDDNGNPVATEVVDMPVSNGRHSVAYATEGYGKYELKAVIDGSQTESNILAIDVLKNGSILETWQILLIVLGVLLLIIIIVAVIIMMGESPDYVLGSVRIKITSRANEDLMIFPENTFNCENAFPEKKSSLSDLIMEYTKWYRMINSGAVAEMTLSQHINSYLTEVADKIAVGGNKKKQTIIKIPAGYEMTVDELEITKPRVIKFKSAEKEISIAFKNQSNSYRIDLVFTR